jgi:cytochrome P450
MSTDGYAAEFDHIGEAWSADPYPIWERLREECPIAHSDSFGGVWLPTRYDDVAAIAYDTENFTSRGVIVTTLRPPSEMAGIGGAPPITADPPFHNKSRRLLLAAFSPAEVAKLEPETRATCRALVDELRGHDDVDAAVGYAQHIPVAVIARMLGLPPEEGDLFRRFVHQVLEDVTTPIDMREPESIDLFTYLMNQVDDHIVRPRDDLISYLLNCHIDGERLHRPDVASMLVLLLIAGVDTTWSAIGASIWHLAGHPDDRRRLVDDPDLLPTAVEELLRAYAPVTMARLVKHDMEWRGCPMKAEEWVLLPFPSANRDPDAFDDADQVIIDRQVNRHAAFGLGVHRCAGSHLARMELRVALEVWLEAFPSFDLADPDAVRWSTGQVRGPRQLPVHIT